MKNSLKDYLQPALFISALVTLFAGLMPLNINAAAAVSAPVSVPVVIAPPPAQVRDVQVNNILGKVTKIDGRKLTLTLSDGSTKEADIPDNVAITRNGQTAAFKDIQLNDQVVITQSQTGQILSVSVTAAQIVELGSLLIPALILLLVLAIGGYTLSRNSNKGHIKTSVAQP